MRLLTEEEINDIEFRTDYIDRGKSSSERGGNEN